MALDVVEGHLHRSHPEVVRTHVEHWQSQLLYDVPRDGASVVASIVHHEDGALPPVVVLRVKVLTELHQEEPEGGAVGLAAVSGVQELARAGQRCYEIHTLRTQGSGHLVLPALLQPATLAFVGGVDHTLVDVHDADSPVEGVNEPCRRKLPLILGGREILEQLDRLHLAVRGIQLGAKVQTQG